jgi:hypothetical protein
MLGRIRHSVYEKALIKEIATTKLACPDHCDVELCFDKKASPAELLARLCQNGV